MNNYRNQEAEAQREKHSFFFDRMNSDGTGPAQSLRWKRELVPVQFLSHLKNLQLVRVADEAAVCGACGGKLGIFSSEH